MIVFVITINTSLFMLIITHDHFNKAKTINFNRKVDLHLWLEVNRTNKINN